MAASAPLWHDFSAVRDLWPDMEGAAATLINLSENHTFRLDWPDGTRRILRVHRPAYHSPAAVRSELAWMRALRADQGLETPIPLRGRDGQWVQDAPFKSADDRRLMVLFAFEEGVEPGPGEALEGVFGQLGTLAARCHQHVRDWRRPKGFVRHSWTETTILDPGGIWGDWRAGPRVEGPVRAQLHRLDARLREDLERYGRGADRFGLIHADMRLANLLIANGRTRLLDFDDCGFGWFGYDFAAGVSFMEDDPAVPALAAAWREGYRRHRTFSSQDAAALPGFVMLRRMALLAWIGSHAEVDLARELAPRFADVTADLAERYFAGRLLSA